MEAALEGDKKKPPEAESKTKRKMKTASQLEILEKAYTEDAYPSESLRAELSVKLELSDRQLQMWFCHRRLKDRKAAPEKGTQKVTPAAGAKMALADATIVHPRGKGQSFLVTSAEPQRGVQRQLLSGGLDAAATKRYFEVQQTVESRAIAFVEAQLGEPLRQDGPILGMEFDPLPPDAFGAPIGAAMVWQQKQSGHLFDEKTSERSDAKIIKGATRALHEYQFIPEQPTVRSEAYEGLVPSYHYGLPSDGPNATISLLPSGHSYLHGNEHMSSEYGFQGSYHGTHPINQLENPFKTSERRRITNEEDVLRVERKHKSEEARVAREVEAHKKRIRKELEKQEVLRRKREEQMRKEMERHDRERQKEEERVLREKHRDEERYQREQRREQERREKFLQKESIRAEKVRQKEELRREKEAAKLSAAKERAIARRIAKESMELIDDERLELMELAASSKGLPSVLSLDYETLQNLELYRDLQTTFPSKDVLLKMPFEVEPWTDSEDNIGSLLMVWRFLITFTDVLGLWPFTLDEFVQAFHDYDPRLLGEIHISLLRSIIKDIEDVARTPSTVLGSNHTSAANSGGGHPLIVEGAYTWGFDIRSWQRHLNPLTWPEILRQYALSAGLGPRLKSRNVATSYLRDDNEGDDGENIVSNLRSGAAVENAFAKMQERGFSKPRRSRHRLTPGTVKFAAFHVLSLEGERGLTILEVADRIQKSGLRDLTTSKTPEASIGAALSRDTKLFERTAPSTYCVRAAYRKDPVDAEAIFSAARERIGIFKSGFFDGEDAEDGERDEDTDSDAAEDPDVDDLGTETIPKKEAQVSEEVNKVNELTLLGNEKEIIQVKMEQRYLQNVGEDLPAMFTESYGKTNNTDSSLCQSDDVIGIRNIAPKLEHEYPDIDESNFGEPWVQGLMEGEYSDLTIDERLNALVALIGMAVEGNSIRLVLEERLEAANALKKHMWAEMQVDKRRMKEEYVMRMYYSPFMVNKSEPNPAISSAQGRPSPFYDAEDNNKERLVDLSIQEERGGDLLIENHRVQSFPTAGNLHMHDIIAGADNHLFQQPGYAVDRPRSQLKSLIGHKAEEMYVYRSLPLGQDRRHNRYWQFITSASHSDPGCGRIFVEFQDSRWRLIDSEEGFDALLSSLDVRGVRESYLHTMLQKIEMVFKKAVRKKMLHTNTARNKDVKTENVAVTHRPDCNIGIDSPISTVCLSDSQMSETSTSFVIEFGRNKNESAAALKRYQDLERWIWKECFTSPMLFAVKNGKKRCKQLLDACDDCHGTYSMGDNHCSYCHQTYDALENHIRFSDHVAQCKEVIKVDQHFPVKSSHAFPLRVRLLKLLLALIEVSVPPEALQAPWTDNHRKSWATKLNSSSSAVDLLQVLTLLESVVKREFLCLDFETSNELLGTLGPRSYAATDSTGPGTVTTLPWVPLTTAAVALRVMEFDAAIFYVLQQKLESQKDKGSGNIVKLSSKYHVGKNPPYDDTIGSPSEANYLNEDNWGDIGVGFGGSGHRNSCGNGRGRTHGSRFQRRAICPRSESNKQNNGTLSQALGWKRRQTGQGRKCGRRGIRSRRKPEKRMVKTNLEEEVVKKSLGSPVRTWNREEDAEDMVGLQLDDAEEASSSGRSEFNDENGRGSEDEYDGMALEHHATGFNGKSDIMDRIEGSVDGDKDNDEVRYGVEEDEQGDFDVDRYIDGDSDDGNRQAGKGEQNMELGRSSSSEYSD